MCPSRPCVRKNPGSTPMMFSFRVNVNRREDRMMSGQPMMKQYFPSAPETRSGVAARHNVVMFRAEYSLRRANARSLPLLFLAKAAKAATKKNSYDFPLRSSRTSRDTSLLLLYSITFFYFNNPLLAMSPSASRAEAALRSRPAEPSRPAGFVGFGVCRASAFMTMPPRRDGFELPRALPPVSATDRFISSGRPNRQSISGR